MQALAEMARVSRATVSRALSDSPLVREETRRRIQKLAERHGYVRNEVASSFRLGRSNIVTVVLMLDSLSKQHVHDPFFLEMIGHVADALHERHYNTLLVPGPIGSAREVLRSRAYHQSEGVIFVGQGRIHSELNLLCDRQVPIIVWGAPLARRKYPVIGADNEEGGYLAARHLLDQGCERIAFFGDRTLPEMSLRHRGYARLLRERGRKVDSSLELRVPFDAEGAMQVVGAFLDKRPAVDGILCCSDLIAMSAISALNAHGVRVPDDIAVIGYDGVAIGELAAPPLTTISQHIAPGGRRLVDALIDLIEGRRVRDTVVSPELVVRKSTLRQSA